jgi:hypothetical protein
VLFFKKRVKIECIPFSAGGNPCCVIFAGVLDFDWIVEGTRILCIRFHSLSFAVCRMCAENKNLRSMEGVNTMTMQCSSTPEAISGILMAGDAVLNLSQQPLNCVGNTRFVSAAGDGLTVKTAPTTVHWRTDLAHSLPAVAEQSVDRIVVVTDADTTDTDLALQALRSADISHVHCTLAGDCDADAFMNEDDAEAVAERLRQLGYM